MNSKKIVAVVSDRRNTVSLVHYFSSSSAVTIGFDAATYTFTETDSTVSRSVSMSVQSGSLARNVVVTVQTVDGSAAGGALFHTETHFVDVLLMFIISPSICSSI